MSWRLGMAMLAAAVLTGCMTPEQVHKSNPVRAETFNGNYKDLAACVTLAWNERMGAIFGLVVDERNRRAVIMAGSETIITQIAPKDVRVEYRRGLSLINNDESMWADVRTCAAKLGDPS